MTERSQSFTRWIAIGIFSISSFLNFLDRQLLAAAAPAIRTEFHLSNAQYGEIVAAFSLAYAITTPVFGILLDRVGLNVGVALSVGLWSLSSVFTGVSQSFSTLIGARIGLGVGESAGIPSVSKASGSYLPASELGFATAVGSIAVAAGTVSAPLLMASLGTVYGWRSGFFLSGALGIPWILLWLFTSRRIPARNGHERGSVSASGRLLRESSLWLIALAYALIMAEYSLWMNWTTLYFVQEHHLSAADANRYFSWIPPIFATCGGFFGGLLAYRWIRRGDFAPHTRFRVCVASMPFVVASGIVPWIPTPELAVIGIGLGVMGCMSMITAIHALPIDLFGPKHAAFSVSLLACCYSLFQAVLSPFIGKVVDKVGFSYVCVVMPLLPLLAVFLAKAAAHESRKAWSTAAAH